MEISTLRGVAFFGLLFIASLFLSPGWVLALLPREWQLWAIRRWTHKHWNHAAIVLATAFFALGAWLVLGDRPMPKHNSHSSRWSPKAPMSVLEMRARP